MDISKIISDAKERGYSKNEIVSLLIKKGYSKEEISQALGTKKSSYKSQESISYTDKFKLLFSSPSGFFQSFKEDSIIESMKLYIFVLLIIFSIQYGLSLILSSFFRDIFGLSYIFGIFGIGFYISYFIASFIGTFIYAGIAHLTLILFKGEDSIGNYTDTYNVITYSLIPTIIILSLIPIIGFLSFIYSIILITFGLSIYHKISKGKAVVAALMPIILAVIFIVLLLFFLISAFRGF